MEKIYLMEQRSPLPSSTANKPASALPPLLASRFLRHGRSGRCSPHCQEWPQRFHETHAALSNIFSSLVTGASKLVVWSGCGDRVILTDTSYVSISPRTARRSRNKLPCFGWFLANSRWTEGRGQRWLSRGVSLSVAISLIPTLRLPLSIWLHASTRTSLYTRFKKMFSGGSGTLCQALTFAEATRTRPGCAFCVAGGQSSLTCERQFDWAEIAPVGRREEGLVAVQPAGPHGYYHSSTS